MKKIKLFKSYISPRAIWNVCALLVRSNHGAYIGEGPEVKKFEEEFAKKFGLKNVAAVNSGTSSLELAYELAGVEKGDEVITPVLTCTATNLPLLHRKAKIIFADTEKDLNINIEDVKRKITPKTKAIVFVHYGGNNRGLKELLEITRNKNITLIEDAAQAVGSAFWGKADFTCVSLQAIKTLTSGDGGFIICKDHDLSLKAKRLRWFGYDRDLKQKAGDTDLIEAGYKYHMSDITAAIGRGNLSVIDKLVSHRQKLMSEYKKIGFIAGIWFASAIVPKRDELTKFLKDRGIDTGVYHYRNDKYTVFGGRQKLPVMDEIEEKYIMFPMHGGVTVGDVRRIAELVKDFYSLQKS